MLLSAFAYWRLRGYGAPRWRGQIRLLKGKQWRVLRCSAAVLAPAPPYWRAFWGILHMPCPLAMVCKTLAAAVLQGIFVTAHHVRTEATNATRARPLLAGLALVGRRIRASLCVDLHPRHRPDLHPRRLRPGFTAAAPKAQASVSLIQATKH